MTPLVFVSPKPQRRPRPLRSPLRAGPRARGSALRTHRPPPPNSTPTKTRNRQSQSPYATPKGYSAHLLAPKARQAVLPTLPAAASPPWLHAIAACSRTPPKASCATTSNHSLRCRVCSFCSDHANLHPTMTIRARPLRIGGAASGVDSDSCFSDADTSPQLLEVIFSQLAIAVEIEQRADAIEC